MAGDAQPRADRRLMVSDAPSEELIEGQVGAYRIERLLGEGAMGVVYRATDPAGELVAVKVVRREIARDAVFRKRFDREARIAREVRNPHVVPVLDAGEHQGRPYLVQRYMAGGSLEQRLEREQRLSIAQAIDVVGQLADGLAALAAQGMVHRDVKPPNVLLDGAGTVLIADFGLVRDSKGTALTRVGQAIGSPHYMAPEQIRGEPVSSATDVYALGCVLCECLSGEPPFAREQGMQVLWAQLTGSPPDPCAALPDAPPGLGAAVLRALAKDTADRPASAPEYVRSVREAAGIGPAGSG